MFDNLGENIRNAIAGAQIVVGGVTGLVAQGQEINKDNFLSTVGIGLYQSNEKSPTEAMEDIHQDLREKQDEERDKELEISNLVQNEVEVGGTPNAQEGSGNAEGSEGGGSSEGNSGGEGSEGNGGEGSGSGEGGGSRGG
jgi:hypothetical protein